MGGVLPSYCQLFVPRNSKKVSAKDINALVEWNDGCTVRCTLSVSAQIAKKTREEAIRRLEQTNSPYSPQMLHEEWESVSKKEVFKIYDSLVDVPKFGIGNSLFISEFRCSLDNGIKLVVFFETFPQVPEVNHRYIKIKRILIPSVEDQDVDGLIASMREVYKTWEKSHDGVATYGNKVVLDIDYINKDNTTKRLQNMGVYILKETTTPDGLINIVNGATIGMVRSGSICIGSLNERLVNESLWELVSKITEKTADSIVPLTITIKNIYSPKLLNDTDLAKRMKVSERDNLRGVMKEWALQRLSKIKESQQRDLVKNALLERYQFQIPATIIQEELIAKMDSLSNNQKFLQKTKTMDRDSILQLLKSIEKQTIDSLRLYYICLNVVAHYGLFSPDGEINMVPSDTVIDKAIDFLQSKVQFDDQSPIEINIGQLVNRER